MSDIESDRPAVEPGQLWIDNDKRSSRTRYVRVSSVQNGLAVCEAWYDEAGAKSRTVRIRVDRFRPVATGYRLAPNQEAS